MDQSVKLNELETVLATLEYPLTPEEAAGECSDVTLILAEGEENLGNIIRKSNGTEFSSVDDLNSEVMNLLPQHAVGEPYQSDGDA